ncbi:MAG: Alkaline serine protease, subtilase family [Actinomycetia bacterium]|nr:Alkaline serine protease, subtilase family [Actinomycetes bacterium]
MRRRHLSLLLPVVALAALSAPAAATNDPARGRQWDLDVIGADAAHQVADGTGITVAVVDSGVDLQHEDLVGRLVPGHDFVDDDDQPQDAFGHGTHVAGVIAATPGNGKGIAGIAPGAKVMPVRVLGADGSGNLDDVVAGVRWAVAHGAKVINLSLGEDTQTLLGPAFGDVLREAWAAGAVPVVSAGNQFLTGSGFRDEPALVVAATDRADAKPTYSSGVGAAQWGIAAPGGELPDLGTDGAILSTYWTGKEPDQYAYLAGTSQAAPHVSAAVAILLSTGRFTPSQAVHRLLDTAKDIGTPGHDPTFGAGRLDLAAATAGLRPGEHGRPGAVSPKPAPPRATTTTTTPVLPGPAVTTPSIPTSVLSPVTTDIVPKRERVALAAGKGDENPTTERTLPAVAALALAAGVAAAAARRRRL